MSVSYKRTLDFPQKKEVLALIPCKLVELLILDSLQRYDKRLSIEDTRIKIDICLRWD